MEAWLNDLDAEGWEFVGYGCKHWHNGPTQDWWVFRRDKHWAEAGNTKA